VAGGEEHFVELFFSCFSIFLFSFVYGRISYVKRQRFLIPEASDNVVARFIELCFA